MAKIPVYCKNYPKIVQFYEQSTPDEDCDNSYCKWINHHNKKIEQVIQNFLDENHINYNIIGRELEELYGKTTRPFCTMYEIPTNLYDETFLEQECRWVLEKLPKMFEETIKYQEWLVEHKDEPRVREFLKEINFEM